MGKERRQQINFRLAEPGVQWIDNLAAEHTKGDRTAVLRIALAVAAKHEKEVADMLRSRM